MEKLLPLPAFLKPNPSPSRASRGPLPLPQGEGIKHSDDAEEVQVGLNLTGYFLEHWAFAHHTKGVPEARVRFKERFDKSLDCFVSVASFSQ